LSNSIVMFCFTAFWCWRHRSRTTLDSRIRGNDDLETAVIPAQAGTEGRCAGAGLCTGLVQPPPGFFVVMRITPFFAAGSG
jgi:hypothetical protein